MSKAFALLTLTLLLTACNGPQTVEVGGSTLTYNSGTWEYFSNELATGLGVKGDESCWIDLEGDLTTPFASEALEAVDNDGTTLYFESGAAIASYVSFEVGSKTLYGRVSLENPESCEGQLMDLASAN